MIDNLCPILTIEYYMLNRYNIALTPVSKSTDIIQLAHQLTDLANHNYLLGKNSLPHVTLYSFQAKENEIHFLWKKVNAVCKEKSLTLEFKKVSCITRDNRVYWISLLPNNLEKLQKMHALIAHTLHLPINKSFDPHMTLLNTKNKKCKLNSFELVSDQFVLSLGLSDNAGQLIKII